MVKILFLLFILNISIFSQVINTAIILENNLNYSKEYLEILSTELNKSFGGTKFKPKISKVIYLNGKSLNSELKKINTDQNIDGIFILSDLSIEQKLNTVPTKFYSIPFGFGENVKPLKENVNYIYSQLNLKEILSAYKNIDGVKTIDVFISNVSSNHIKKLNKETKIPKIKTNIKRVSEKELKNTSNPTLLISFDQSLNDYAYAGIDTKREAKKRLRASTLNYMFHKTKNDLGKIVRVNDFRNDMFFNVNVAHRIGLYPNLIFLQSIAQINEVKEEKTFLSFKAAIERALKLNFSILESEQNVKTNKYELSTTNSSRLPQLSANISYSALDNRAPVVQAGTPENITNSYLELSQIIFNDQLNAAVDIQKLVLDSSRLAYEQEKLDVVFLTASTYVNILQLTAQLDIQESNNLLLKETLEVARLNYRVGTGNLQDVYRLESDVASSFAAIAKIKGQIRNQEINLNTILRSAKDNSYKYETLEEISKYFVLTDVLNRKNSYGSERTKKVENFLIEGAISNSNSLMTINNTIKAKEREIVANRRERYIPKIQVIAKYNKDNLITPSGRNSNIGYYDEYWETGIAVSLPLISGGEIYYNSKKLNSELTSLEISMANAQNELAKEVLQAYTELTSNYLQSYSTAISADVAKKNLEIVKSLYSEGTITITDFLSAQNNTLSQELNNVIQNFNLINSALKLENLYGESSMTIAPEKKSKLLKQFYEILEN